MVTATGRGATDGPAGGHVIETDSRVKIVTLDNGLRVYLPQPDPPPGIVTTEVWR